MLRALSALVLVAAVVGPGHAVAQSPPVASPLGTLDGFQGFLAEHGFTFVLEPLDTAPTSWGAVGTSGDLEANALWQADSLLQVNLMVVLSGDDPVERDADLAAIRAFAPEALAPAADRAGRLPRARWHEDGRKRVVGPLVCCRG